MDPEGGEEFLCENPLLALFGRMFLYQTTSIFLCLLIYHWTTTILLGKNSENSATTFLLLTEWTIFSPIWFCKQTAGPECYFQTFLNSELFHILGDDPPIPPTPSSVVIPSTPPSLIVYPLIPPVAVLYPYHTPDLTVVCPLIPSDLLQAGWYVWLRSFSFSFSFQPQFQFSDTAGRATHCVLLA